MLVHLIADFGAHDLAFAEVAQQLKRTLPEAELVVTTVPPFATLAAGFCAAQLALNAPPGTVVFHNVAPRRDEAGARRNNDGERLAYVGLENGVKVVGVNAGHAFSFFRRVKAQCAYVNVASDGSQFRSRDLFPGAVAAVVRGAPGALAETLEPHHIPDLPAGVIAYCDGFGNLKTTLQAHEVPASGTLEVTLAGKNGPVRQRVTVADGSFSVPHGELCLAPGSSGWSDGQGGQIRWLELFLRGGSAFEVFGRPEVGAKLELSQPS